MLSLIFDVPPCFEHSSGVILILNRLSRISVRLGTRDQRLAMEMSETDLLVSEVHS